MYDYIRQLADGLKENDLIELFGNIAMLDNTLICKDWEELIASVGVEGFLALAQTMGGKTFTLPTIYQVIFVSAAMLVAQRIDTDGYDSALNTVLGGMQLEGFRELTYKIYQLTHGSNTVTDV